jgi:outer membrane biosynthesis protein TonB
MSELGASDEVLKITFLVSSKQDLDLFNWLQTHPFKSTSAAVRALLNIGAAAMVAMRDSLPASAPESAPQPKKAKVARAKKSVAVPAPKNSQPIQVQKPQEESPKPALSTVQSQPIKFVQEPSHQANDQEVFMATSDLNAALDAFNAFDKRF